MSTFFVSLYFYSLKELLNSYQDSFKVDFNYLPDWCYLKILKKNFFFLIRAFSLESKKQSLSLIPVGLRDPFKLGLHVWSSHAAITLQIRHFTQLNYRTSLPVAYGCPVSGAGYVRSKPSTARRSPHSR